MQNQFRLSTQLYGIMPFMATVLDCNKIVSWLKWAIEDCLNDLMYLYCLYSCTNISIAVLSMSQFVKICHASGKDQSSVTSETYIYIYIQFKVSPTSGFIYGQKYIGNLELRKTFSIHQQMNKRMSDIFWQCRKATEVCSITFSSEMSI